MMMNVTWNQAVHGNTAGLAVAPDANLYQRDTFRDQQLVCAQLDTLFGREGTVRTCDILNVWYIPGSALQVVYAAHLHDHACQIVTIAFYPRDTSLAAYQAALLVCQDGVYHLPAWDAIAWLFPADPALAYLAALQDGAYVRQHLNTVLPQQLPPAAHFSWKLLSYLPGERCSMMYQFGSGEHMFIGKIQTGNLAEENHTRLTQLWQSRQRRFRMAEPLTVDSERGIRWERFVAGHRFEAMIGSQAFEAVVMQALESLGNLHQVTLEGVPALGPHHVLARIGRKTLRRIRQVLPILAESSDSLVDMLTAQADWLADRPYCLIHGDFHTANMLVDEDGVILLDLDNLSWGDPAYDLALFGSRMLLLALNNGSRLHEMAKLVERLPALYRDLHGVEIPDEVFAWYMAALLIGRQIKTSIRHYAPALGSLAPLLLGYAHETLRQGRFEARIVAV